MTDYKRYGMNSTLFLTGFGAYMVFLIWLGWFVSRNQKSGEDFLLGGRGLPMFLVLGTTVATMVGTPAPRTNHLDTSLSDFF